MHLHVKNRETVSMVRALQIDYNNLQERNTTSCKILLSYIGAPIGVLFRLCQYCHQRPQPHTNRFRSQQIYSSVESYSSHANTY